MESLLLVSFDNISSRSLNKIRKGCRQIEGLLAQICLVPPQQALPLSDTSHSIKSLGQLPDDLVFQEFFHLQESFQWNTATRLVVCLERLLGLRSSAETDQLIVSVLGLIHGMLLLHPPSRSLFAREIYINVLLDLLDPTADDAVISTTLLVLASALLDQPLNARVLEKAEGLSTLSCLLKSQQTSQHVKIMVADILAFYLMPERPDHDRNKLSASSPTGETQEARSRLPLRSLRSESSLSSDSDGSIRSVKEKRVLLSQYLEKIDDWILQTDLSSPVSSLGSRSLCIA